MSCARRLALVAAALGTALATAPAALAVTDAELKNGLPEGGSTVPHLSMDSSGGLLRGLVGLAIVVGVILIVSRVLKANQGRRGSIGGTSDAVEVLSTTPLGPSRHVHVLRIGSEVVVVGAGEGGMVKLRELGTDEAVEAGLLPPEYAPGSEASFAAALARAGAPADPARTGFAVPPAPARTQRRSLADRLRDLSAR